MKVDIWVFFEKTVEKIQVSLKSDKNNGTLHEDQYTILIISHSLLLRMRNVSDKIHKGNQDTHFVFSNFFFQKSCRLRYNVEKYCRAGQTTDDSMEHAHCMLNNLSYRHTNTHTHTHSQYVILFSFPLQQWLQELTSMLRLCTLSALFLFV